MKGVGRIALALAPALALVGISLWEIAATRGARKGPIGAEAWVEAAKALRREHRGGELIVSAPRWIDPLLRYHVGDLIPLSAAGRMDSATFGRTWELSLGDHRHPETVALRPSETRRFGALRLHRYDKQPTEVVTSFVEALPTARIAGNAFRSPRVTFTSIDFHARRCVRVDVGVGDAVRIRYAGAALGNELVGYAGLVDEFPRLRDRSERALLALSVGGAAVAQLEVTGRWRRFSAKTKDNTTAEVVFEISPTGHPRANRLVCFAAEARR